MADKVSGKRTGNRSWKGIYGTDKAYTARVDRAQERDQYTEPGTPSNAPKSKQKDRQR